MNKTASTDRQIRELEASIGHRKTVAASLRRNGYTGAAAEVLGLVGTLQSRLEMRLRDAALQKPRRQIDFSEPAADPS